MYLGSKSAETLLCIREESLSCGASKSAVRRHWLCLCTVWQSHSRISTLSTAILALGKDRSRREPNLGCRGADRPGWCDALQEKPARQLWNGQTHCHDGDDLLARSLWMRRSHSTQDRSTASHCQLPSPRESDCLRLQSKVSWPAAKLHQGHASGSRDIQNCWILSGQPSYLYQSYQDFLWWKNWISKYCQINFRHQTFHV